MIKRLLFFVLSLAIGLMVLAQEATIELTGEWEYSVGDSIHYNDFVVLPGTVEADGKIWFRKSVYVPHAWEKQRITLFLEHPLGETTLFVNGQEVGRRTSLFTPHQYEISYYLVSGQRNKIVVCVNKGIVGLMGLKRQSPKLYINKVKIEPDMKRRVAHLTMTADGTRRVLEDYPVIVDIWQVGKENRAPVSWLFSMDGREMSEDFLLGNEVFVWDEFRPRLYRIGITLGDDYYETVFGMRGFSVQKGQLYINGCPIWLRGTVDDGHFPETGYPPMGEDEWTGIIQKYKEYGLNCLRFRSYCPPETAFAAADKLGFYLLPDTSMVDEFLRMAEFNGYHPSLMMLPDSVHALNIQELSPCDVLPDTKEVRDRLRENGMEHQADMLLMASGQRQTLWYKDEIERSLCDNDNAGFMLSSFNHHANAEEWRNFCSPVVSLARFPKYVYANTDSLVVPVNVYNAMYGDIEKTRNNYYIVDDSSRVVTGGVLATGTIPLGKNLDSGTVRLSLEEIKHPSKLSLVVAVAGKLKNEWDFWVYPTDSVETTDDVSQDIFVSDALDNTALEVLKKGGKVLLTVAGKVQQGGAGTLGTYIAQSHPLFKYDFPTDGWANRNWQELLDEAQAMDLTTLPKEYQSPIQPIDQAETCRKLGMLVEANVLKGKLLVTTMDISNGLDHRLVARQMRKAILAYMQSDDFTPTITLQPQIVSQILQP